MAALQVYVDTHQLFPVKNDDDWFTNCQTAQKRLDTIFYSMPAITHKLTKRGFLTNSISKEWRSKKPGHEMYSLEYLTSNGTETQFLIVNGEYHSFTNLGDAEKFLQLYTAIYDIITKDKIKKNSTTEIIIVVKKVAKRIQMKG